jgi:hypothetical protein
MLIPPTRFALGEGGMQTSASAKGWLESIRNWITEILGTNPNPQATGQYVDVGVQTNAPSLWGSVKQWFLEVCSVRGSQLSSMDTVIFESLLSMNPSDYGYLIHKGL